jgi:hypothetical protein
MTGWVEPHLPLRQRTAQLLAEGEMRRAVAIARLVVDHPPAVLALGGVHRRVGSPYQCFRIIAVPGEQRDADAGNQCDAVALDLERRFECAHHLVGDSQRLLVAGGRQQEGEFIAAEARHRIGIAHHAPHAPGRLAQHGIAAGMAQRIVDLLEVIEIGEHEGKAVMIALRRANRLRQPVHQQHAIRQAGERIVHGLEFQRVVGAAARSFEPLLHVVEGAPQSGRDRQTHVVIAVADPGKRLRHLAQRAIHAQAECPDDDHAERDRAAAQREPGLPVRQAGKERRGNCREDEARHRGGTGHHERPAYADALHGPGYRASAQPGDPGHAAESAGPQGAVIGERHGKDIVGEQSVGGGENREAFAVLVQARETVAGAGPQPSLPVEVEHENMVRRQSVGDGEIAPVLAVETG